MKTSLRRIASYASLSCALGALVSVPACSVDDLPGGLDCGLSCNESAFLEGSASISGIASVDAFFGAALDVEAAATGIAGSLQAELDAIALSVGLEPGTGGAEIAAQVNVMFMTNLEGGISIEFAPPRCEASFEASASAAAECDVDVQPGELSVSCEGSCEVEAGVAVDCGAEATLTCTGTAPMLACSGTCSGTCTAEVDGSAACTGTCNGTCDGTCSLTNAQGNCVGECDGNCTGQCDIQMEAGATCEGSCAGECTYDAPEGGCEASASAHCEAEADASVECSGSCAGKVTEPSVSAECQATVEAKAEASMECFPPELVVSYHLSPEVSADINAKASFTAWLEGFKGHLSTILALRAKGEVLIGSVANLGVAGEAAINDLAAGLSASVDLKLQAGGICALANLPAAASALGAAGTDLSASVETSAGFMAELDI